MDISSNVLCFYHIAGVSSELIEESKFVPLNADDPVFGPPVSSGQFFTIIVEGPFLSEIFHPYFQL